MLEPEYGSKIPLLERSREISNLEMTFQNRQRVLKNGRSKSLRSF